MKLFFYLGLIFTVQISHAQCPNISGSFRGMCFETRSDGGTSKYDMQYDVTQTGCEKIEIRVLSFPDELSVMEIYDLKNGLTQFDGDQNVKIMSGGHFFEDSFAGTLLYQDLNEGTVDTVYNQYRKVSKNQANFLTLDQTGHGIKMTCELPQIDL